MRDGERRSPERRTSRVRDEERRQPDAQPQGPKEEKGQVWGPRAPDAGTQEQEGCLLAPLKKLGSMFTSEGLGQKLDELTLEERQGENWFLRPWDRKHAQQTKLTLVTVLWVLALLVKVLTGGQVTSLMLLGMSLFWVSSAMLIRYRPVRRLVRQYYLWGLVCFTLGQGAYLGAMVIVYNHTQTFGMWLFWLGLFVYAVITVLILFNYLLPNRDQPLALRLIYLLNAALLCLMGAYGITLCIATAGRGALVMIGGALLYLASLLHATISFGEIKMHHPDVWIWLWYTLAQVCLLVGMGMISGGN